MLSSFSSQSLTSPTMALVSLPASVRLIKEVASVAVGLLGLGGCWARASQHIEPLRDGLKMVRVHTPCIPTEMIENQPICDTPYPQLISDSVGQARSLVEEEVAIASWAAGTSPLPTGLGNLDLVEEAFKCARWDMLSLHQEPPTLGVMRQAVSAVLPLPIVQECS